MLFGAVGDAPLASTRIRGSPAPGFAAYNRWLADFCAHDPSRLIGVAVIPCDDPDDAIAEVRASAALGLRGVVHRHTPGRGEWT